MTVQQLVELGTVATGQTRGLGHVPCSQLEQAGQITAFEPVTRLLERLVFKLFAL